MPCAVHTVRMRPGRKSGLRGGSVGVVQEDVENIPLVDAVYEPTAVLDGPDISFFGHDAALLAKYEIFRRRFRRIGRVLVSLIVIADALCGFFPVLRTENR